jgi:hypothetical protein
MARSIRFAKEQRLELERRADPGLLPGVSPHHTSRKGHAMKRVPLASFVLLSVLFAGCTQYMGSFTALSTYDFDTSHVDRAHLVKRNIDETVTVPTILFVPLGKPTLDDAVSEVLSRTGGDFLTNARVYSYFWSAIVFGKMGFTVKADAYKTLD